MKKIVGNRLKAARWFFLLLAAAGMGCTGTQTEAGWPEVTQETKPWTRWWWPGSAVDEKNLTAQLEAFRDAGLGGVEITPIYGVRGEEDKFIDYLSPQWMDKLLYTLREAKRLGLGVDLANAAGWPFGGPWIGEEHAAKTVVPKTYRLSGGQRLTEEITCIQQPIVRMQSRKKVSVDEVKYPLEANLPRQEYAFDQVRYRKELPLVALTANKVSGNTFSECVDLRDKMSGKKLDWEAPSGEWVICALFQGDHGKMVERAAPGGEGRVIDHFSEKALMTYLKKFDAAFSGKDVSGIRCFFNDSYEVDDADGEANWTPEFLAEFRERCGYDLTRYLPALLGMDAELSPRVLYDYRTVVGQLLMDRYTRVWQHWAAAQGKKIRNQAHGSPANVLDLYAASDIPETEGWDIVNLKSAASAAHVSGKRLVSAETCTWLDEHFKGTLGDAKNAVDCMWLAGVNHVFYHGTAYSPQEAPWPGWLFYAAEHFTPANSYWEDFGALNRYVARAQSFLQAGAPYNEVLLYFPIADKWSEPARRGWLMHFQADMLSDDLPSGECARWLQAKGYSWDAISDSQLQHVAFADGLFRVSESEYRVLVVPKARLMPADTFEKLVDLARAGATVLFYGGLPEDVPGLAGLESSRKRMEEAKACLSFASQGNVRVAACGKGRILVSPHLPTLLGETDARPEEMTDAGLQYIRRKKEKGGCYYFIKNGTDEDFGGWVPLNAGERFAVLYNPLTGQSGQARVRGDGERKEIYLQLAPGETRVVETRNKESRVPSYPYYKVDGTPVKLGGAWTLRFVKGGPSLPDVQRLEAPLASWTLLPGGDTFSGTAEYTVTIPSLSIRPDVWMLDLDEVHESASVRVNGTCIGTLIGAPYRLPIPASLLKSDGTDTLTVRVSNLMANRIAGLDKQGVEWRKFYNTNFNARYPEDRGADGLFTAAHWEPAASGICGTPVLIPLRLLP